jgi:hypothetical protein
MNRENSARSASPVRRRTDSSRGELGPFDFSSIQNHPYLAAWSLAFFATDPSSRYWALVYMFPLGLAAFVNLRLGNDGGWGVLAACIAVYLLHAYFYFRSKNFPSLIIWFAVLVLLLVCNIAGCRAMLPRH